MSISNFKKFWELRDEIDHEEGLLAYQRYNTVMSWFADYYGFPISITTEVFAALSPNSDYHGNLRSMASVLDACNKGIPVEQVTVSTYNACRNRAYSYAMGTTKFTETVKGLKITAFRHNILYPTTSQEVTIDGHMIGIWHDAPMSTTDAAKLMKSAKVYKEIATCVKEFASTVDHLPLQVQAILWLTRKRVLQVKYDPQLSLFREKNDAHSTLCKPEDYLPYPIKKG